jgi:tRNA threonylcarbamoyladenosine modification (KEOPS) complex Cgi121 subunit
MTTAYVKAYLCPAGMSPSDAKKELSLKNPEALVQTAKAGNVDNELFLEMLAAQTLLAQSSGALLAKKPEVDLLLRLAGTAQISKAISRHGSREGKKFLAIVAGSKKVKAPPGFDSYQLKRKELSEKELDRIERAALLDAERA